MKFKSCQWITHGIDFESEHLKMCCDRCHKGGGNIILKKNFKGEIPDWEKIFKTKSKYIKENKKGKINPKCEGCFNLVEKEWDEKNKYISTIHFTHWTHCNAKCLYCFTKENKEYYNSQRYYNVLPIIKDLIEKNLFKPNGIISFAGGEPTVLEEFEDLLDLLIENNVPKIIIHSSGIKYSPAIAKGIKKGIVELVLSIDAGSIDTFKKIKNVNAYTKVIQNAKKYAEAENTEHYPLVSTKYVILPNINDNIEEAEKWLQMNKKNNIRSVIIDIEAAWYNKQRDNASMPQQTRELIEYVQKRADELGLQLTLYNSAGYFKHNEKDFPKYDFIPYEYPKSD